MAMLAYAGVPLAALTGIYTAWLFKQAKGRAWSRDKWLTTKMSIETLVAGLAGTFVLTFDVGLFGTANTAGLVQIALAAVLIWAVSVHGHHAVRGPQLETLH